MRYCQFRYIISNVKQNLLNLNWTPTWLNKFTMISRDKLLNKNFYILFC